MEFISAHDIALKWGISKRRVQMLCATNRIENAVRIGNMWVVPSSAEKPADARHKETAVKARVKIINPIKIARTRNRILSETIFNSLVCSGFSKSEAKIRTIVLFASELLCHVCSPNKRDEDLRKKARTAICKVLFLNDCILPDNLEGKFSMDFCQFISDNTFCFDDSLSWCYQYVNKISGDTGIEATQFFTEKYMITTLVDKNDILASSGKILDPACGGGNFLLYCFDILAEAYIDKLECSTEKMKKIKCIFSRLFGYEIDSILAAVASINLRLKAMAILASYNLPVSIQDFIDIEPRIFRSAEKSQWGALDCDKEHHELVLVGSTRTSTMKTVFSDVTYLFTNPPFQTVKGMPNELKKYLKINYPDAKCDMCNAFIELALNTLSFRGRCGLVTQNSWLYLDSFIAFRKKLLSSCSIKTVIELGSNAFYDLSGEKANVALLCFKKEIPTKETTISLVSLKNLLQSDFERLLSSNADMSEYENYVSQEEVCSNKSVRFDMFSSQHLKEILLNNEPYGNYAIPMQGTSTGDAKTLIDYYWKHIDDQNWKAVSKGGGYSRWQGLNNYCVKWGNNGEYIKAMPGSAIRNVSYFDVTQLVFSDTGTAGLNVRKLQTGQMFVASGPGIRVINGDEYAHMAFLNSRIASYYIRLLSPKLTIAAGYIAKLPVFKKLMFSESLSDNAKQCLRTKRRRLEKRPCNMEFRPIKFDNANKSLYEYAYAWYKEDIFDEWAQLCCEQAIEEEIADAFSLRNYDFGIIEAQVGIKRVYAKKTEKLEVANVLEALSNILDSNCMISRTRVNKVSLGCDGIVEYIAQKIGCSCEAVYKVMLRKEFFDLALKDQYMRLFLHALTMSALFFGYTSFNNSTSITVDMLAKRIVEICPSIADEAQGITIWLREEFSKIHAEAFMNEPLFVYDTKTDLIECVKGDKNNI
ncbi:MAG: class I SAM-dependent DNA methyltransferase [Acidaminococcaceae bacterium]